MNAFWDFSVTRYAWPGVEIAALDLQDRQGFDVNLVFWCVWLASQGRVPGASLDQAFAIAADWHSRVTGPVRALRRSLKSGAGAETVYDKVLAAELEAERALQNRLAKLLPETDVTQARPKKAALKSLVAYAALIHKTGDFEAFLSAVFPAGETV